MGIPVQGQRHNPQDEPIHVKGQVLIWPSETIWVVVPAAKPIEDPRRAGGCGTALGYTNPVLHCFFKLDSQSDQRMRR